MINDMGVDTNKALLLRKGIIASKRSTLILMLLSIVEGSVSFLSGSIALFADAIHTVMDIAGSAVVWIGLKLSLRAPTDRFPYGFYKAESISTLTVSIIVIFTGIEILRRSIEKLYVPSAISLRLIVIAVAIGSGLVSYVLARYKERVGREIESQALRVESKHSLTDVLNAGLVSGGVLFTYLNILWAEALAGLVISVFVVWSGVKFGKDAIFSLMDVSVEPAKRNEIKAAMITTPEVRGVHALKIRRSGPFMFAEAHVEVDRGTTVEKAHEIVNEVEKRVKQRVKGIDSITIHIGAVHRKDQL